MSYKENKSLFSEPNNKKQNKRLIRSDKSSLKNLFEATIKILELINKIFLEWNVKDDCINLENIVYPWVEGISIG